MAIAATASVAILSVAVALLFRASGAVTGSGANCNEDNRDDHHQ